MSKKFSSGHGWAFVSEGKKPKKAKVTSLPPSEQRLHIRFERRAAGKIMTIIEHAVLSEPDRKALAKKLKSQCGVGGSIREDGIELQGDVRDRAKDALEKLGYGIK